MALGRPTDYTEELAAAFCSEIAQGKSLRATCKMDGMPSTQTVYNWFNKYPTFIEQYARAKEDSADSRADQIEEIAEKVLTGEYEPQAARVAIDAFKWTSGKHKPKKYGDRQYIETKDVTEDLTDDQLNARIKALLNESGD